MNRQSRREDVLFVLALLVPAIVAGARYSQSSHEAAELIASQKATVQLVQARGVDNGRRG